MNESTLELPSGWDSKPHMRNNCGIIASASITGLPYDVCEDAWWHVLSSKKFRKIRSRWNGCTSSSFMEEFAREAGVVIYATYLPRTMSGWDVFNLLNGKGRFSVRVGGHMMVYENGWIMDQRGIGRPSLRDRRRRCCRFFWSPETNNTKEPSSRLQVEQHGL